MAEDQDNTTQQEGNSTPTQQQQVPGMEEAFSERNIDRVDQAIKSGELNREDVPSHVQAELAQRGSNQFVVEESASERAEAGSASESANEESTGEQKNEGSAGQESANQPDMADGPDEVDSAFEQPTPDDGEDPFEEADQLYQQAQETPSNEHDERMLAGLRIAKGDDARQAALSATSSPNAKDELEVEVQNSIEESYRRFEEDMKSYHQGASTQGEVLDQAEKVAENSKALQTLIDLDEDEVKVAKAYVAYNSGDFSSLQDLEDETAEQIMAMDVSDLAQSRDWIDKAGDFLKGFVPGDITEDQADILGWSSQVPFLNDTQEEWASMALQFRSMEPEERLRKWEGIKNYILEHTTEGEAIGLMQDLIGVSDRDPAENLQMSQMLSRLDQIDFASIASPLIRAGAGAAKAGNVSGTARRLKNGLNAKKAKMDALNDEAVARATGTTRAEAADSSIPAKHNPNLNPPDRVDKSIKDIEARLEVVKERRKNLQEQADDAANRGDDATADEILLSDEFGSLKTEERKLEEAVNLSPFARSEARAKARGKSPDKSTIKDLYKQGKLKHLSLEEAEDLVGLRAGNVSSPSFVNAEQEVIDDLPLRMQEELGNFQTKLDRTVDDMVNGTSVLRESPFVTPEEALRAQKDKNKQLSEIYENHKYAATKIDVQDIGGGEMKATVSLTRKKRLDPEVVPQGFQEKPRTTALSNETRTGQVLQDTQDTLNDMIDKGIITTRGADQIVKTAMANRAGITDLEDVMKWARRKQRAGIRIDARGREFRDQLNKLRIRGTDTQEYTITPRIDETTGKYTQERLSPVSWAQSNLQAAKTPDTKETARGAIRLDNLSAKVSQQLENEYKEIISELPLEAKPGIIPYGRKKAKINVQRALVEGDEYVDPQTGQEAGRVWTKSELQNKFGLSEPEIKAYYKARSLEDRLGVLKDIAAGQELRAQGFKHLEMTSTGPAGGRNFKVNEVAAPVGDDVDTIVKRLDNVTDGDGRVTGVREIYDTTTGNTVTRDQFRDVLEDRLNKGQTVVKFQDPIRPSDAGKRYAYAIVPENKLGRIPLRGVLKFKPGHVSRVYDRGVYFVKKTGPQRINGLDQDQFPHSTIGMADNKRAADELARKENERLLAEGDTTSKVQVFSDREIDPIEMMSSGANGGRLFTRSRGDAPVPMFKLGKNGELIEEKATRVDALKQIESDIHNIGQQYPRNLWRVAAVQRLKNTADDLGVKFNGMDEPVTGPNDAAVRFLERQRVQTRDWLHMATSGERRWESLMQQVYEGVLDKPIVNKGAEGVWWIKSQNPATLAKGSAFHMLLGWFNPVQLFVQAQGFSPAFGNQLFRMGGPSNLADIWRKQFLLNTTKHSVTDDVARGVARMTDMDPNEVKTLTNAYQRSGLQEGLLTTGDYTAAQMGLGYDVSAIKDFANRRGLMFYRAGEEFNRRFSFTSAMEDFYRRNPNRGRADNLTDSELQWVTARANNYMLNMGRANRAPWQKGLMGIPTQFWQVQAKLIEQLIGPEFTGAEKLRVMAGQIGLYGAAGVPILGTFAEEEANQAFRDLEHPGRRTITEGAWGLAFASMGADVDVANRGAIFANVEQTIKDLFYGQKSLGDVALGAFGALGPRTDRAVQNLDVLRQAMWSDKMDPDQGTVLTTVSSFTDILSSMSGPTKAWIMLNSGGVPGPDGTRISNKDQNILTTLMTAAGFRPLEEQATYDLNTMNRMYSSYKSDMKKATKQFTLRYLNMTGSEFSAEESDNLLSVMSYMLKDLSHGDRQDMINELLEEVQKGKSEYAKAMNERLGHISDLGTDDIMGLIERASTSQAVIDEDQLDVNEMNLINEDLE